jgi:hypothetical protein
MFPPESIVLSYFSIVQENAEKSRGNSQISLHEQRAAGFDACGPSFGRKERI